MSRQVAVNESARRREMQRIRYARWVENQQRKAAGLPPLPRRERAVRFKTDEERRENNRAWQRRAYAKKRKADGFRMNTTQADMAKRYDELCAILEDMHPMTVRQVFYQATVRGIVEKTEAGYEKVKRALVRLRHEGRVPFEWLEDNTRAVDALRTFENLGDALQDSVDSYRMDYWADAPERVQIWIEKDALAGIIRPVCYDSNVPLVVARGFASWSLFYEAVQHYIGVFDGVTHIYHLGDHDPSGQNAGEKVDSSLKHLMADESHKIEFHKLGVTPEQIEELNLPTRPTKKTDKRAKNFKGRSCELDALTPEQLRGLVRGAIEAHMGANELEDYKVTEEINRMKLQRTVDRLRRNRGN